MYVFRYNYRLHGRAVSGAVIAADRSAARALLSRAKTAYTSIGVDWMATLDLLARPNTMPWTELTKLYKALARGQASGALLSILDGAAEYLTHYKVTNAVAHIRAGTIAGLSLSDSMKNSGLPAQHVEVVAASARGATQAEALRSLLDDCFRRAAINGKLRRAVSFPIFVSFLILLIAWGLTSFYLPAMAVQIKPQISQLSKLQTLNLSTFVLKDIAFGEWVAENRLLFGALFWGVVIGGTLFFTQSKFVQQQLLRIRNIRIIREMTEMATIWPVYALLRERVPPNEVCMLLSKTSTIPESAVWFRRMYNALRSGANDAEAVVRSEFPLYVVSAVSLGAKRGDLKGELNDAAADWIDQVDRAAEQLGMQLQVLSWIFAGALLTFVIVAVLYPRWAINMASL